VRFAVRGFRAFEDWTEFEGARITALYGPNATGKSGLVAARLLLAAQTDLFRLSFAGAPPDQPRFIDALHDHDPAGKMEFRLGFAVDAAAALVPRGRLRPEPVEYEFELFLSYMADPFDGGSSGLLVDCALDFIWEDSRTELFSAKSVEGGGELSLATAEILGLPFVSARAVAAGSEGSDDVAVIDAGIEVASNLAGASRGEAAARAQRLRSSLEGARREALLDREFERLILPLAPDRRERHSWFLPREKTCRYAADEPKYLRSLADILIAESFAANGIRSMRSVESGREIRLSFHSVFQEILAAAGFLRGEGRRAPLHFPLGLVPVASGFPERGTAAGASALVLGALGDYSALLRDAVNYAACRKDDGSCSIEGSRLDEPYGRAIIAHRETRGGVSLVTEGRDYDPQVLDLEARRRTLSTFLSDSGIAEDLEFAAGASEDFAISLARKGTRLRIGDLPAGLRRMVIIACSLLYLPWGSLLVIEEPEAGLDPVFQGRMAELLRLIARETGADILVETRSAALVSALGPYRAEQTPERRSVASVDGLVRVLRLVPCAEDSGFA
jgi:hypothetical protein